MSPEVIALLAIMTTNPLVDYQNSATYTKDIKPLLAKHCIMCHNKQVMPAANWNDYDMVFKARFKIKSRIWTQRNMPPGGGTITDKERDSIKEWIDKGARK